MLKRFIKEEGNVYIIYFAYVHTVAYILGIFLCRARSLILAGPLPAQDSP